MRYQIIIAETLSELEERVQEYLDAHWQVTGGLVLGIQGERPVWAQAVVDYNPVPEGD